MRVLAGVFVLLLVAAGFKVHSHLFGDASALSAQEWLRLRSRWFGQVDAEAAPVPLEDLAPSYVAEFPRPKAPRKRPWSGPSPEVRELQMTAYLEKRSKSVLELQPFRLTNRAAIEAPDGRTGEAVLVNLNPTVNRWYLLELRWSDGPVETYHLVNAHPRSLDLALDPAYPYGLLLVDDVDARGCDLWGLGGASVLDVARESSSPYAVLCGEDVTLRLRTPGRRTAMEWTTDFLRDNVWGGEEITVFVREALFEDAFLSTSDTLRAGAAPVEDDQGELAPRPASLRVEAGEVLLVPEELGLTLSGSADDKVPAGRWLALRHHPTVFASVVRPNLIHGEILASHRGRVAALDPVESEALVYLVAFDLESFELGFAIGTDHPRVSWSARVPETTLDPSLPGPDGIGDISPLVATGIVPRSDAHRTIATFTGGFKRDHGAFRTSELSRLSSGSHYGFIESGVILSKLQPGLATVFSLDDGRVEMKTWTSEDDVLLPRIDSARQNGLPLIERDPEGGPSVPGSRVSRWADGNWSGSQDRSFRTVRAGACLQAAEDQRYLIYAYFSSATPSAMARVFQAYDCEYAMMLDMNALEHTYFAIYHPDSEALAVQHLIRGMEVLDKRVGDQVLPRFLGFADNRDFFYLKRRELVVVEP